MPFEESYTIEELRGADEEERAYSYQKSEQDVACEVVLNTEAYGKGLPGGKPGEVQKGFSFFELRQEKEVTKASYITSRITEIPVLEAVSEEQYKSWGKKEIIARPAEFVWSEEKNIWVIEGRSGE